MSQVTQESVTIETLELLQKTLDYLKRLPVVPMTRALCREIEAHLADPNTMAAKHMAVDSEKLANTRVARQFTPVGQLRLECVVTPDEVNFRVYKIISSRKENEDRLLDSLRKGVTMRLEKWSPLDR